MFSITNDQDLERNDQYNIRSVQRALKLLTCFSLKEPEQDLVQLSAKMGLHKSTVHRLVKTLEGEGFLQKNNFRETYELGIRLFELGTVVHETMDIRNIALPVMRELSDRLGYMVFLSQLVKGKKVCIEKVSAKQGLQPSIKVGQVVSLHVGGSGKVLLAYMDEKEVEKVLENNLEPFTEKTTVKKEELRKQLIEIRANGYALGFEEKVVGGAGISAPIFDVYGRVTASLSLVGPTEAIRCEAERFIPHVVEAAKTISSKLGYHSEE